MQPVCPQVDRVLEQYAGRKGKPDEYLVKWLGLEYTDATWETEPEVNRDGKGRVSRTQPPVPGTSSVYILLQDKGIPVLHNV